MDTERFATGSWTAGVVGLGYVGLPLAMTASSRERHGFEVVYADDVGQWDAGIVLTEHDDVDYGRLAKDVGFVLDTRGVYRRRGPIVDNVIAL